MSALISALSGVTLLSAEDGVVHLQLRISALHPLSLGPHSMIYSLKIAIDPISHSLGPVALDPCDVPFEDILAVPHPQKLAFLVCCFAWNDHIVVDLFHQDAVTCPSC